MKLANPKVILPIFGFLFLLIGIDAWLRWGREMSAVCNEGIAFGMPLPAWLLWPMTVLLLLGAIGHLIRTSGSWSGLAWFAVLLGGAMNALDRILHGCVTDYLTLPLFPSFNLADMMLLLGGLYLIGTLSRRSPKDESYVS